jgi:hypothetical protein
MSNGYERWHCVVRGISGPDLVSARYQATARRIGALALGGGAGARRPTATMDGCAAYGAAAVSMNSSISISGPMWLSEMKAVTPRPERCSTCSMNFCFIAF